MPFRVGIVGSRDYPSKSDIASFVNKLPDGTEVISGGARGVDTWAVQAAEKRGLPTHVFHPNKHIPSPQRYFARNTQIVDRAWVIVAFSVTRDGTTPTRGTSDTLRKAEKAGIPAITVLRKGKTYHLSANKTAVEMGLVE